MIYNKSARILYASQKIPSAPKVIHVILIYFPTRVSAKGGCHLAKKGHATMINLFHVGTYVRICVGRATGGTGMTCVFGGEVSEYGRFLAGLATSLLLGATM